MNIMTKEAKNLTFSERAALLRTIRPRAPRGRPSYAQLKIDLPTVAQAAELAGFRSHQAAYRVLRIVDHGIPELIAAMDKGEVTPTLAERISHYAPAEQKQILEHPHLLGPEQKKRRVLNFTPVKPTDRQLAAWIRTFRTWPRADRRTAAVIIYNTPDWKGPDDD
jgi:hypothetical protein